MSSPNYNEARNAETPVLQFFAPSLPESSSTHLLFYLLASGVPLFLSVSVLIFVRLSLTWDLMAVALIAADLSNVENPKAKRWHLQNADLKFYGYFKTTTYICTYDRRMTPLKENGNQKSKLDQIKSSWKGSFLGFQKIFAEIIWFGRKALMYKIF